MHIRQLDPAPMVEPGGRSLRSFLLALAVAGLFLIPGVAYSTSLEYTMIGSYGDKIAFQISSQTRTPLPCTAHPPDCFAQWPVTVDFNGSPIAGLEIDFAGPSEYGGLTIDQQFHTAEYVNTFGPVLFSGTLASPDLLTGTFSLTTDTCCGAIYTDPTWTLTVTQTTTPAPEPSTLVLLSSTLIGLAGVWQRTSRST